MKTFRAFGIVAMVALVAGIAGFGVGVRAQVGGVIAKEVFKQALTEVEGKELRVLQLEFKAGAVSPPHRHPGDTFVYVIDGELTTEINDGAAFTAKAGEVFHEPPMALHKSTRNNGSESAHAIAIMVIDKDAHSTVAP